MQIHFFRRRGKDTPQKPDTRAEISREYFRQLERLEQIRARFDLAEEEEEIDALIYEENAALCRVKRLAGLAAEEGHRSS